MQSEKSIQINHRIARNVDRRTHCVIRLFGMWDNDIQSIGGAALEDHDQPLVLDAERLHGIRGASQKSGNGGGSDNRDSAVTNKYATSDWHKISSWLLALSL